MEPLQTIIYNDEGLYGVDEIVALSIVNVYGRLGSLISGTSIKPSLVYLKN